MAISFVNGAAGSGNAGTSVTTSFNATAGNCIVVTVSDDSGVTSNSYTVTDTAGNSYTRQIFQASVTTIQVYTALNISGNASNVVTVTWNTGNTSKCAVVAQQFSGVATSSAVYGAAFAGGSSTAPSANTGASITTGDFVVGCLSYGSTTATTSLGSGYTNLTAQDQAAAGAAMESKAAASTAVQTAAFSLSATETWIDGVIGLVAAGGAAATTPKTLGLMGVGI